MQSVAEMGTKFSKHTDDYTSFLFHLQMRGCAAESGLDNFVLKNVVPTAQFSLNHGGHQWFAPSHIPFLHC